MIRREYEALEQYMLSCICDSAHDAEHIYRVLYTALDIAGQEANVDFDVLIPACLLHDIGRKEQFEDPSLCHAAVGAEKAAVFLREQGFTPERIEKIAACIRSHRYRSSTRPESVEAKILFDADKLDVTGALGCARSLLYNGEMGDPLYFRRSDGSVADTDDTRSCFFHEYKRKLEKLYDGFLTRRGEELARQRRQAAMHFYESLWQEIVPVYRKGQALLDSCLTASGADAVGKQS